MIIRAAFFVAAITVIVIYAGKRLETTSETLIWFNCKPPIHNGAFTPC